MGKRGDTLRRKNDKKYKVTVPSRGGPQEKRKGEYKRKMRTKTRR